jgi:hypothetical protein
MSSARAVRYRRLASAAKVKADADLLLKLADECDRGFSAWLNGVRRGHPSKMSSRQKQETPRDGLGGTHSMTDVENLSQTGPPRARQRYLIAAKL